MQIICNNTFFLYRWLWVFNNAWLQNAVIIFHLIALAERALTTFNVIGPAVLNGGLSTFLAFVLLGFSQAYVFTTFFKVWIQCYKYKYNHCKRNGSAIISYIVSVDHVRSGVRIISWITISASDTEFGRTRWEKARQLKKESSYAISQRLLYRPSVSKWER